MNHAGMDQTDYTEAKKAEEPSVYEHLSRADEVLRKLNAQFSDMLGDPNMPGTDQEGPMTLRRLAASVDSAARALMGKAQTVFREIGPAL